MNFRDACLEALNTGTFKSLEVYLKSHQYHDSFEVLFDPEIALEVARGTETTEIQNWITRRQTWDTGNFGPADKFTNAERLLSVLWQNLSQSLNRKMEELRRHANVSSNGAVICFPGGAKLSVLVSFNDATTAGVARLRPLSVGVSPEGMLEIERLLQDTTRERKNELKKAIISVDKITLFRSTIIHVNRQLEDVFGPTIDTILLTSILAEELHSAPQKNISVLEIGPGSGLIAVHAASIEKVSRVCAVEINFPSVACTIKNFAVNGFRPSSRFKSISIRAEKFSPSLYDEKFDYIVCNPPYIPELEDVEKLKSSGYGAAISGLELYSEIFSSLDQLLAPLGRALLMTSSVSLLDVEKLKPDQYRITRAESSSRRVPLDLDLLWDRPDWRQSLIDKKAIELGEDGQMFHTLVPIWVERKAN